MIVTTATEKCETPPRARPSRKGMTYRRKENRAEKLVRDQANFSNYPDEKLVSIDVAAWVLDRHRATVWAMIARAELAAVRIGGNTKIRVGELRRLISGSK